MRMSEQAVWKKKGNYPLWTVLQVISTRNAFFEAKYKRIDSINEELVSAEMSTAGQDSAGMGSWKEKYYCFSYTLGPDPVRSSGYGVAADLAPEMGRK